MDACEAKSEAVDEFRYCLNAVLFFKPVRAMPAIVLAARTAFQMILSRENTKTIFDIVINVLL